MFLHSTTVNTENKPGGFSVQICKTDQPAYLQVRTSLSLGNVFPLEPSDIISMADRILWSL